jgi:uncharacterized protein YecE (DUF72 family)
MKDATERKSVRMLRREKQRRANVDRAAKMHAARIADISKSSKIKTYKKTQYYIGCSGWFYWHWRGVFYPENISTAKWFDYYISHFNTVELNAPFYSWPTIATVKSWIRQAENSNFIYTVKVCEIITHIKRFKDTKELVKDFGYIGDLLDNKMGCFLFQLPPSFHYTPIRLKNILSQLDKNRCNVIEFRHKSWWNNKVYDAFSSANVIFCSCSGPELPDELIKTSDDVYVRFHGVRQWYRYNYSDEELAVWAERIHDSRPRRVWAYFNNDSGGYAIDNAKTLLKQLKKLEGERE